LKVTVEFVGYISVRAGAKKASLNVQKGTFEGIKEVLTKHYNYRDWGANDEKAAYIVFLNGQRCKWDSALTIRDGDVLTFFPLVAGG